MPLTLRRAASAAALLACLHAHGQETTAPPANSAMDAPLFYQLLIGEIELTGGQPGVAYQVLLDAARRTNDEALFKRVVNIAVQSRAGDQALTAARAWALALPASAEAQQMTVQLLALLNRPAEVPEPLRALIRLSAPDQRTGVLASLPRLFARSPEPKRVLAVLTPVLQAQAGPLRPAALFAHARLALNAGENAQALALTRELAAALPEGDDAMQLAIDLMPVAPEAESLVTARLQQRPDQFALRQAYGRALAKAQRPVEAAREFRTLTEAAPDNPAPWLALGALELELRHTAAAEAALGQAIKRLDAAQPPNPDARRQAGLLLAQAAEQRGDLPAAEAALQKLDGGGLDLAYRRASLLARQGKLADARQLLQAPEGAPDTDARARLLAEAQLLREQRDFASALAVLQAANERFKDDPDLIYEQAMMAERLGRFAEMEAQLQRVIALKADHHHALNALGYSLADRNLRLPEARQLIVRALALAPGEPFIVDSLGWVEFRLGNLAEATRLLRLAHAARPDAEIAAHLGEVLWVAGQPDEARRVWADAAKRDPRNDALRETLERLKVRP